MTRDEVKPILATIEATYPGYFKNEAGDAARQRLNVWAVALANEPAQEVHAALIETLKVCKFPPTVADIFEQLRARRAASLPGEAEMWRVTCRTARKIRTNIERAAYGGYVDAAGKHSPAELRAENKAAFDALPDAVKAWAGGPGELAAMLDREDADLLAYVRPGFKRAIEAAQALQIHNIEAIPSEQRTRYTSIEMAGQYGEFTTNKT